MEIKNLDKTSPASGVVEHQRALKVILCEFDRVCKMLDIPYVLFAGTMLGAVRHQGFIPWDDDLDVLMMRDDYDRFIKNAESLLDSKKFYLQKEFSDSWPMFFSKLRMNGTACLEKYHPKDKNSHQGIYIDLFPCDNTISSELGRKLQYLTSKVVIAKSLYKRGYDTDSKAKKFFMYFCRCLPLKPFLAVTKMGKNDSKLVHSFLGGAKDYAKNIYPRRYFESRIDVKFEGEDYPISREYDSLLTMLYGNYMELPSPEMRDCKKHAILIDTNNSYEIYRDYRDNMEFSSYTRSIR